MKQPMGLTSKGFFIDALRHEHWLDLIKVYNIYN